MPKSIVKTTGEDHHGALANELDEALENVTVELEHVGAAIHDYAEDALSKASTVLNRAAHARTSTPAVVRRSRTR